MTLASLIRRLRGTVRTNAFEEQMDAEMRHHLDLETDAGLARGLSPSDARADALKRFGSLAEVKDECRDSWGVRALDALGQDVRFGMRNLLRHRGYTAVVLLTLGLGIGANTAVFSVVHAVLLAPLPYANGDRLIEIRQEAPGAGIDDLSLSAKEVADYREQAQTLDAVVEYHQMWFNLLGQGEVSRVQTGVVSANFFDALGVKPLLGRTFVARDDTKDAPPVLVLSYGYWQHALGGDPHVIGRTFEMNDKVHTVVGVLPAVPQYPQENDVYMPVSACPFRSSPSMESNRAMRMVSAIGRMRPGVSLARADGDLAVIAKRMVATYPNDYKGAAAGGFTTTALSIKSELTRRARPTLLVLLVTTLFVLLLVAANVANLTLARVIGRERELSLRTALGAGRSRIVRQLVTESTLLAIGGGALGLFFAFAVRGMLVAFTAKFTARADEIAIDPAVLGFALAVSLLTGLACGLVPAFSRRAQPADGLKDGQRTVGGPAGRARHALIGAQVAISFVLLIGAGLMVRSFVKLTQVDAGFNADHVLTARVSLDWVKYNTQAKRRDFFARVLDGVGEVPGATAAAVTIKFPLDESTPFNTGFVIDGQPVPDGQARPQADFHIASPAYFQTVGMTVLRGRAFTDADRADAPPVAIVNLAMARHHFHDADAIGQRVSFDGGDHWATVVGMVNDVKQYGLDAPSTDEIYLPLAQNGPLNATVMVRTSGDPRAFAASVRDVVRGLDPKQPVSHIETLEEARSSSLTSPRLTALLVTLFALVALVVTAAGIAGVVSFSVNQRTAEIGVRMALGAPRATVVRMIVRQGLAPVAVGLTIGVLGALPLARLIGHLLFAVEPTDPATFAAVIVVLSAVAATACFVPARRAAAIDPMQALRAD